MPQSYNTHPKNSITLSSLPIKGFWDFTEMVNGTVVDLSGNDHTLIVIGDPILGKETQLPGSILLNGETQWAGTNNPVVSTDKSFSIAAWVYLDSTLMSGQLALKEGENALTAVSQDSSTHGGFYLGLRRYEEAQPNGTTAAIFRWCFALAPISMDQSGVHARSEKLDDSILDKWVLLVGVCDVFNRKAKIYIPTISQSGEGDMPDSWVLWKAENGFQIGRGQWMKQNVDQWPGKIGPVRVFSGELTMEEAKRLQAEDFENF
jgi:hypothetical protein